MSAIIMTFDTHTFYTRLKNVGFSEQQADAIAEIQKETATAAIEQTRHDYHLDEIATKRDLKELELKIELVRADLKRDLAESKAELSRTILTVGMGVGLTQLVAIFILFMRVTGKV